MQDKSINDIASTHLGSGGSYAVYTDKFDPSLLVAMPRYLARQDWNITGKEFVGYDVWHCHEATFLTNNGLPIAGTLKIVYNAATELMVESKSMKLYLNSFDMCKMGDSILEAIRKYEIQVKHDLETLLQDNVEVCFHANGNQERGKNSLLEYLNIYDLIDDLQDLKFDDYQAKENHLNFQFLEDYRQQVDVFTNVLRSRCRHTKQKDTGSAFLSIATNNGYFDLASVLRQIVSLREQNEFHEFCAEKLFVDFMGHEKFVDSLMIALLYTRRGSLDINPIRATSYDVIPPELYTASIFTLKTEEQ